MTIDPEHQTFDADDPPLHALLRRADRGVPSIDAKRLKAQVLSQAAFLLAARRRSARTSMADTLAAWGRVALPLAAAAALFAALTLSRIDTTVVVDAELRDSDPAALLSALEADGSSGLAHHLIASDQESTSTELESAR